MRVVSGLFDRIAMPKVFFSPLLFKNLLLCPKSEWPRSPIVRVTKRLANSAVQAGIGITTTVGRFSTGSIRTCKGLPSGSQKILVILHSPKLIEVHLQLRLTLLSGVFVCDCKIDISNRCIQIVGFALPHCRTPGTELSVAISRSKFSVLTFNVISGRVLEHSFNKRVMSRIG